MFNKVLTTGVGNDDKDNAILVELARYGVTTPKQIESVLNTLSLGQLGGRKPNALAYAEYENNKASVDDFVEAFRRMLEGLHFTMSE